MTQRERKCFAPLICLFALSVVLFCYLLTAGRDVRFTTHGVPLYGKSIRKENNHALRYLYSVGRARLCADAVS